VVRGSACPAKSRDRLMSEPLSRAVVRAVTRSEWTVMPGSVRASWRTGARAPDRAAGKRQSLRNPSRPEPRGVFIGGKRGAGLQSRDTRYLDPRIQSLERLRMEWHVRSSRLPQDSEHATPATGLAAVTPEFGQLPTRQPVAGPRPRRAAPDREYPLGRWIVHRADVGTRRQAWRLSVPPQTPGAQTCRGRVGSRVAVESQVR